MVTVNLSYYNSPRNGSSQEWFRLVSNSYTGDSLLRTGDEDLRALDFFLKSTYPLHVEAHFSGGKRVSSLRKNKILSKILDYNRALGRKPFFK